LPHHHEVSMQPSRVFAKADDVDFTLTQLQPRKRSSSVLMASPDHFDVLYVINPHMEGNVGSVDQDLAMKQWLNLVEVYEGLGYAVERLPGVPGLPDIVFTANQSFPYIDSGERIAVISRMASVHRRPEVEYFAEWYESKGFRVIRQVQPPVNFEGMGDARWHPGRRLLYIGYGYRTDLQALSRAASLFSCPVIALELIDPHFYHLDTALSPLDERTALYVEEAFTPEGVSMLRKLFPRLIRAPLHEAKEGFVTNGHCPDRKHFIAHHGSPLSFAALEEHGFKVIEVDTSEFLKSGGSVYCMKMMLP
jgi:N-dimethylarginine dimethylaminohydrolase